MELADTGKDLQHALFDAFEPLPIHPSTSFGRDNSVYEDADNFLAGLVGETWLSLLPQFLEEYCEAFYYLSPEGFRSLLPAFLWSAVSEFGELGSLPGAVAFGLQRPTEAGGEQSRFDLRVALLNERQVELVILGLERLSARFDEEARKGTRPWMPTRSNPAQDALDGYWSAIKAEVQDATVL